MSKSHKHNKYGEPVREQYYRAARLISSRKRNQSSFKTERLRAEELNLVDLKHHNKDI